MATHVLDEDDFPHPRLEFSLLPIATMTPDSLVPEAPMPDGTRYDEDFNLWSLDQARRLRDAARVGINIAVDWENVAEEIEGLTRSDRHQLQSHLDTVYEHLLKLQYSPAENPRNGWKATITESRRQVARLLDTSPSLRRLVDDWIISNLTSVEKSTALKLADFGEDPAALSVRLSTGRHLAKRVLEEDFFPHPPTPVTEAPT